MDKDIIIKIEQETINPLYIEILYDFYLRIKEKQLYIESFEEYSYFKSRKELEVMIHNLLKNIESLETIKDKEFIQNILNSNYFMLCELIPEEYKINKNILNNITLIFNTKSKLEKKIIFKELIKLKKLKLNPIELKIEYFKIFFPQISEEQEKIFRNLKTEQAIIILKEFNKKNYKEKENYIRSIGNKIENIKNKPIYNVDFYNIKNDKNLTNTKIEILKNAYFFKGINLEEFKNDLKSELYNCDNGQLQNYVNVFVKYKEGFLTSKEYDFSKILINEYSISQEELAQDVLPIIEKYNLSQQEIRESIDIGSKRNFGDTKKFLDLAIVAKQHGYTDREIMILLKDSKEKTTENVYLKMETIKEYGNCDITKTSNLVSLDKNNFIKGDFINEK